MKMDVFNNAGCWQFCECTQLTRLLHGHLQEIGSSTFDPRSAETNLHPHHHHHLGTTTTASQSDPFATKNPPSAGRICDTFPKFPFATKNPPSVGRICDTFRCVVCNKSFVTKGDYRRHYRIHTGEKPFACSYCPYRANQSPNLGRHVKRRHPDKTPLGGEFMC